MGDRGGAKKRAGGDIWGERRWGRVGGVPEASSFLMMKECRMEWVIMSSVETCLLRGGAGERGGEGGRGEREEAGRGRKLGEGGLGPYPRQAMFSW